MSPVAMHPLVARHLNEWRKASPYSKDGDWVFASSREKGRVPRAASTCGKHYLRPAAFRAGALSPGDNSRFGWHNLRHSLATFLGGANDIHAVNDKQLEAQGLFLKAIKHDRKRTRVRRGNRGRV
jgi:integrase